MQRVKNCKQGLLERANFLPRQVGLAITQACARYTTGHRLKYCKLGSLEPVPQHSMQGLDCFQPPTMVSSCWAGPHDSGSANDRKPAAEPPHPCSYCPSLALQARALMHSNFGHWPHLQIAKRVNCLVAMSSARDISAALPMFNDSATTLLGSNVDAEKPRGGLACSASERHNADI